MYRRRCAASQVKWRGPLFAVRGHQRGLVRRERAACRIEAPDREVVAAQAGGDHVAVRGIGVDRVRVRLGREQLLHGADRAVLADRVDGDLVPAVRRREQPAPAAVDVDVGHAVGERRFAALDQSPAAGIDRERDDAKRLRAQRRVEHAAVRAQRHRHRGAADRDRLDDLQLAVRAVEREHRDLLGSRHSTRRRRCRPHAPARRVAARAAQASATSARIIQHGLPHLKNSSGSHIENAGT